MFELAQASPPAPMGEEAAIQRVTLLLCDVTAADYLAWVRDPEPAALGGALRGVVVHAQPLGGRIDLVLSWAGPAPAPGAAVALAGFPQTPDVVEVLAGP